MPHNKNGDHYANPSYGKMMEGGKAKGDMAMEAYGEKAAEYAKMGYMVNKIEVEYAENGFVVKCHWEEPYDKKKKNGGMAMAYMEPTVKVFENAKDMAYFVQHVFNDYRHGYSGAYPHTKTSKAKASTTSKLGGGRKQTNYPPKAKSNPHGGMNY